MRYLKITIADFYHPATSVRQISKCASRTITGRIFAAGLHMVGGISDPAAGGGSASAQRYAAKHKQLGYRVSIVGYFRKVRNSKG